MDTTTTLLCQPSTGQEDDWKNLYESAFPQDERMAVEEIRQFLSKGSMLLHRTTNRSNELLCFSLTFPVTDSDFTLLSYIATDPTKRSGGFGSKHMRRLIEILKGQYPNQLGLFLEIESTRESGLDEATQKARKRRLEFYQRLGAKRLSKSYLWPSMTAGAAPRQAELLWIEFGTRTIDDAVIARVISEIYAKAYNLAATDPIVQKVLSQFSHIAGGTPNKEEGSGSSTAAADAQTHRTASDIGASAPDKK